MQYIQGGPKVRGMLTNVDYSLTDASVIILQLIKITPRTSEFQVCTLFGFQCITMSWHFLQDTRNIFHHTFKIVSEMTYNVSMGTLNPTIPFHHTFTMLPLYLAKNEMWQKWQTDYTLGLYIIILWKLIKQ